MSPIVISFPLTSQVLTSDPAGASVNVRDLALNNPEPILRMERYSESWCVYISSANPGPSLSLEVWNRLGLKCSFRGYDTTFPYEYLRLLGRRPELKFFKNTMRHSHTSKESVSMQERYISKYRELTPDVKEIIRDVVDSHSHDGIVDETKTLTLGLLMWKPHLR